MRSWSIQRSTSTYLCSVRSSGTSSPRRSTRPARATRQLVVYLQGPYGVGKQSVAEAGGRRLGGGCCSSTADRWRRGAKTSSGRTWSGIEREARLQDALLFWEGFDALLVDERPFHFAAAQRLLEARRGPTVLAGESAWAPVDALHDAAFVRIELPRPDYDERCCCGVATSAARTSILQRWPACSA